MNPSQPVETGFHVCHNTILGIPAMDSECEARVESLKFERLRQH